jgi:1A family penicillin-binding protein
MKKKKKNNSISFEKLLYKILFRILFIIITFFIFVGEIIKKIIFFFFLIIKSIFLFFYSILKKIIQIFYKPKEVVGKKPSSRFRKYIRPFDFIIIKLRYFLFGSLITIVLFSFIQSYFFVSNLPSPDNIGKINYPLSTHIYDRNNKLLYEIYRDQNRTPVKLKNLPTHVYQSTIAIEDKDFYRHNGVSLISGILRALREILVKKDLQGGSTITQQLVKSALLTPERTFKRKIKELILALWTERLYTKEEILEMYLNQVPYGGSSYGIEEAAKTFFDKHAKDLTLDEAALLAGLPQAPSVYSPFTNPQAAVYRRNEVLQKMYEQRYITKEQKDKAQQIKLNAIFPKTDIRAPHFVFYVKGLLEDIYGIKEVEEGGLRVTTTLDLDLQEQSEKILKEELEKIKNLNVTNGAVLITRPQTGEILAMVGSVDYFATPSGAFNVVTAPRQPGSSIKPIMYSLALQKDYTGATIIDDSPVVFAIPGAETYRPVNYDGRFHGRIPLRYALANSYNVPAVKVLNSIGVQNFVDHARRMGISTWSDSSRFGLSLTLGGGEVTMLDMAKAFGVFADYGYRQELTSFLHVDPESQKKIYQPSASKTKVLDEGIAYIISDILSDSFARRFAFGPNSALEIPGYKVAVKTGTTDLKKDNWTIGYTPQFLVVVWVGNNDNSPMNPYLSSGITGAAPIWNRVINYLLKKYNDGKTWFPVPEDIVEKNCYFGRKEYFLKGTDAKAQCSVAVFDQSLTPSPTKTP